MEFLDSLGEQQLKLMYVGIVLICGLLYAAIAWMTWPAPLQALKDLRDFFATLPVRWRVLRDPAYRKRVAAAANYETAVCEVVIARYVHKDAQNAPPAEEGREEARERRISEAMDAKLEVRRAALAIFLDLDDDALRFVAEHVRERWLRNATSVDDIVAFLKDEQDIFKAAPHLMDTHLLRFTQRFSRSYPATSP